MNLATAVTVPVEAAQRMRDEYRALGARATDEDRAIARVFDEIAKGHSVIDIRQAIPAGGCDELGRPRLCFGRADEQEVRYTRETRWSWDAAGHQLREPGQGALHFSPSNRNAWDTIAASRWLELPADALTAWEQHPDSEWFAMVPIIPAALRPKPALSNYHILWEAEWRAKSAFVVPPRDPALLKQIRGSLYSVLAVWDLTDVERLILGMREAVTPA